MVLLVHVNFICFVVKFGCLVIMWCERRMVYTLTPGRRLHHIIQSSVSNAATVDMFLLFARGPHKHARVKGNSKSNEKQFLFLFIYKSKPNACWRVSMANKTPHNDVERIIITCTQIKYIRSIYVSIMSSCQGQASHTVRRAIFRASEQMWSTSSRPEKRCPLQRNVLSSGRRLVMQNASNALKFIEHKNQTHKHAAETT